jgi:hypothetical protein
MLEGSLDNVFSFEGIVDDCSVREASVEIPSFTNKPLDVSGSSADPMLEGAAGDDASMAGGLAEVPSFFNDPEDVPSFAEDVMEDTSISEVFVNVVSKLGSSADDIFELEISAVDASIFEGSEDVSSNLEAVVENA